MKNPWEWNEQDLLDLVTNQIEESLNLDYKASDALRKDSAKTNEIAKDVSAFANSAGGTIVYGMAEDRHLPTGLDAGLDPRDITKEWLEQIILSKISPRIDGIRIAAIPIANSHPGRVAYVVHIPSSVRAPHMAGNKYYKRFNFLSQAMEDFEVRDTMRRQSIPDLRLALAPSDSKFTVDQAVVTNLQVVMNLHVVNQSEEPAHNFVVRLFIPEGLHFWYGPWRDGGQENYLHKGVETTANIVVKAFGSTELRTPVFKTIGLEILSTSWNFHQNYKQYFLRWEIHAPYCSVKSGVFVIRRIGIYFLVEDDDFTIVDA